MSDEVLALLESLIACPSVTPNDAGCHRLVAERLAAVGFRVEILPSNGVTNLWATHGDSGPLVCLAGHVDVVPAGPREAWHSDPFVPAQVGGHVVGRGAADMKAGVAAMTVALERLAREEHAGTIALLLTSDEEGPGVDGTRYVLDFLAENGVRIDAAIVGEPTSEVAFGDTVKIGRRGSMNGRLVVSGVQGHTAYPHLATNAVHRLAPALEALVREDWGSGTAEFPPTSVQVSNLHAGTGATNVVPGKAELCFNARFGTDWTAEGLQARIVDIFRSHGVVESIEWQVSALPFLTSPGPLLSSLTEAVREETERVPNASTGGGTSDARFFAAHGIPVAEFGPINATIHAANERVAIADLEPLARIYAGAVRRLLA